MLTEFPFLLFQTQKESKKDNIIQNILERSMQIAQNFQEQKRIYGSHFQFPGHILLANFHRQASKFKSKLEEVDGLQLICPCCGASIRSQPLNIFQEDEIFKKKVKSGVYLYFMFIKVVIMYLLFRLIFVDLFNILTNYFYGNQCLKLGQKICQPIYLNLLSSYNKIQNTSLIQTLQVLNLFTIILSIPFFIVYRKIILEVYDTIDGDTYTEDDFTLFLTNIPLFHKDNQQDQQFNEEYGPLHHIKQLLTSKIQTWLDGYYLFQKYNPGQIEYQYYQVTKQKKLNKKIISTVSLCFDLSQLNKIRAMRQETLQSLETKLSELEYQQSQTAKSFIKTNKELVQIYIKLELQLTKNYMREKRALFNVTHFLGSALVSFEYKHYREYIMRQIRADNNFLKSGDSIINACKASSPKDIFWINLSLSKKERFQKILVSFAIMFMILFFAFASCFLLKIPQTSKSIEKKKLLYFLITNSATLLTLIINFLLMIVIEKLTEYQSHETRSKRFSSLVIKVLICQFINYALIYVCVAKVNDQVHIFSPHGLIAQVNSLIIIAGILGIILNLVYSQDIISRFLRWYKYRKLKSGDTAMTYQLKLNKQFEHPQFKIPSLYCYYLLQLYTFSFFSYLIPIGSFIGIIILSIRYWIDRKNLFNRCSLPYDVDFELSRLITKLFQFSLLIFASGNLLFSQYLQPKSFSLVNLISIFIAATYIFFAFSLSEIQQRNLFRSKKIIEQQSWTECNKRQLFKERYWFENPITKYISEKQFLEAEKQSQWDKYSQIDKSVKSIPQSPKMVAFKLDESVSRKLKTSRNQH